jgi:uncharacterized protein (DUF2141 family)
MLPIARRVAGRCVTAIVLTILAAGPSEGQGAIRGVVHAPPGGDVRGAVVVACFLVDGRCDYAAPHRNSRAVRIDTRGASARFVVQNLPAGEYILLGTHDLNGNGVEDAGDRIAQYGSAEAPRRVRPPAEGVELRFTDFVARASSPPTAARRPSAPPARPGGGGLSGIYHGVNRQVVAPGPGSGVASGITWTPGRDWMTFFEDGRVYLALPEEGLGARFDWERECQASPSWCASYRVEGDVVRIRWASGEQRVLRRASDGSLTTEDRLNYLPMERLNGLRLQGRYSIPWKTYSPVTIEFTRDGRFREEDLLNNIGWMILRKYDDPRDRDAARDAARRGSYSVRDNTLELRYDGGRTARITIYVFPQELRKSVPEEIYLNAHDFRRVR